VCVSQSSELYTADTAKPTDFRRLDVNFRALTLASSTDEGLLYVGVARPGNGTDTGENAILTFSAGIDTSEPVSEAILDAIPFQLTPTKEGLVIACLVSEGEYRHYLLNDGIRRQDYKYSEVRIW
jgi:hypothetical protein